MERGKMMLTKSNSFFFSKILYKNVHTVPDSVFGKLNDVVLDFSSQKPVIAALEIRIGSRLTYVTADFMEIYHDEQIVDIHGQKVERVNDVRVGLIAGKWTLLAVDIGMRGLMRRLGIEYPL